MDEQKKPYLARTYAGITITGQRLAVAVYPSMDRRLRVNVYARAEATGFDRDCVLSSEVSSDFDSSEIRITGFVLECLRVALPSIPEYREGFSVVLEAGMPDLLQSWLPRLQRVGAFSHAIHEAYGVLSNRRPFPHQTSIIDAVAASYLLDGDDFELAVEREIANFKDEHEFRSVMLSDDVRRVVLSAA